MKHWSLNGKISFVLGVFLAGCLTIAIFGVSRLDRLNESLNFLVETVANRALLAQEADAQTNGIMNLEKVLVL